MSTVLHNALFVIRKITFKLISVVIYNLAIVLNLRNVYNLNRSSLKYILRNVNVEPIA